MDRATQVVHGSLPAVERATIHAYEDATPGPVYYQRFAHPVGLEAERLLGELEGGRSLLFGSGSAATIGLVLALLEPGATVAVADGGYWGTVALLRSELGRWGLEVVTFDQTAGPPQRAELVWLEPCSNPMLTFPDLDARGARPLGGLARAAGPTASQRRARGRRGSVGGSAAGARRASAG
jgi:cystathionine beta-lyase/cystathionine gamma-synthase